MLQSFGFFHSPLNRKILLLVFLLSGFGLVQVYSSSYIFSIETYGDGLFFFKKQAVFLLLGFLALFFLAILPWTISRVLGILLWCLSVVLLLGTIIPGLSHKVGGAERWLNTGLGFLFQPAELFKATTPFAFMYLIALKEDHFSKSPGLFYPVSLFAFALPLLVLSLQPDFGTIVLFCCLTLGVVFILGLRWHVIFPVLGVMFAGLFFMAQKPYRWVRIKALVDPWSDPLDSGFQMIQSMVTFYSGSFFGTGLGQGQGKLFFLPEAHTDFTLAIIGEEAGLVGFCVLLSLYALLVFYGFKVVLRARLASQRVLAFSLVMVFALSVCIHMGVNLGILPTKGITLPFISYGGSSLLCTFLIWGWIINLEKQNYFAY